ncbi:MAG: alpha-ribazole phosphatase [Coprobacter sp.]|nr:alpha-ribazole phosphatase [Coprobacter sp.]
MTEIWFIRHTSVDVPKGTCYGRSDVPLQSTFPQESAKVRQLLLGETFDEVWSSPLSRCTRLASACGYETVVQTDDRLLELDFGAWEMKRFDDITDVQLQRWFDDWLNVSPTGGESFRQQCQRVARFLDDLRRRDVHRVLVFAHGGVLLAAGIYAGLYTFENAFSKLTPYGGLLSIGLP